MNMMSPVPIEPIHPMRRMHRNNCERVSALPTNASPTNSGPAIGRKGGGCFTGLGTDLTFVVGGTTLHIVGRPGRIRRSTPYGTLMSATTSVDGHGRH